MSPLAYGAALLLAACSSSFNYEGSRHPAQQLGDPSSSSRISTANPLRDPLKLQHVRIEKMLALSNAKIVLADYELIRRDFPALNTYSEYEIDQWLLSQTAYMSRGQAAQETVNSSIPIEETKMIKAYRPQGYGRAHVFEMKISDERVGLIDVKGSGAVNPSQTSHGNGLASLGEVVREYLFENLSRETLRVAESPVKTIGSYAVIDAGFDIKHADGSSSRAGLYLRQASMRHTAGFAMTNEADKTIETFRKVGVLLEDGNIQMTTKGYLIDFGHYYVSPALSPIIPFDVWGYNKSATIPAERWATSRHDNPWNWSHELAQAWAEGRADRNAARQHFQNFLEPAKKVLAVNKALLKSATLFQKCSDLFKGLVN